MQSRAESVQVTLLIYLAPGSFWRALTLNYAFEGEII
ncbi:MAG: hypothetical protein CM15mP120_00550 [Pseudomonadota bacterium]|nr:MAG: hypothetical protein CM15mP120_00550 [Pseudomonadota bacterium]